MDSTVPEAYKAPRKNKREESQLVNMAIRWLYLQGCYVWRNNTGAFKAQGSNRYIAFGLKGSADIIGMVGTGPNRGRFIAVECKSTKGRIKPEQKLFRDRVLAKGGFYILARSLDDLIMWQGSIT